MDKCVQIGASVSLAQISRALYYTRKKAYDNVSL